MSSVLAESLIKSTASIVVELVKQYVRRSGGGGVSRVDPEFHLRNHITYVYRWAHEFQIYGMSSPVDLNKVTIELDIQSIPRKFYSIGGDRSKNITEKKILYGPENYMILGSPGSGKTTTMRRLIERMMRVDSFTDESSFQYPILIRPRNFSGSVSLVGEIASIIDVDVKKLSGEDWDKSNEVGEKASLFDFVVDYLNQTRAIVFIDGLDEAGPGSKHNLELQISSLAMILSGAKIIVSCRSGDYNRHIEGFNVIEISPLKEQFVKKISNKWLGIRKSREFFKEINEHPLFQLTDRPLFLFQLLLLYRDQFYIPDNVAEVYRRVTLLTLEKWDSHRGIYRRSKYSGFTPDRKLEFLAHFAYELLFFVGEGAAVTFGTGELRAIYEKVHSGYGLPVSESREVISEIESHTGIIIETSSQGFEFSHLTLQEYLAAYHLVRNPFPENMRRYLAVSPAPLAIAVSISANPSVYFAGLILKNEHRGYFKGPQIGVFLDRLLIERPFFHVETLLGLAVLSLVFEYISDEKIITIVRKILKMNNVKQSVSQGLQHYRIGQSGINNTVEITKLFDHPNTYGLITPNGGGIDSEIYNEITSHTR